MVPATIYHLQRRLRLKTRGAVEFSVKLVYGLASMAATNTMAVNINRINFVIKLQESLNSRGNKLAGYIRHDIKNCVDASTTSPIESNNSTVKQGPARVVLNMNLNTVNVRLMRGVVNQLRRRQNEAHHALCKNNHS